MNKPQLILFIIFVNFVHPLSAENNMQMDSLLTITQTIKDTALVNTFLRIAEINTYSNQDTAIYYLGKAENEATKINYHEGYSKALFMHGSILYFNNNYSEALDCFTKSLELSKKVNNKLLKAKCLERMASLHLTLGDDHLALKLYYESLDLFEQENEREGIAKVYNIIGVSKSNQGKYDTAAYYFQKAIRLNEEIGNQTGIIHNNGNLAYMYHEMGKTEQAKSIYLNLVPKLIETSDNNDLAVIYYHLSIFYRKANQPDSTLFFLRKAFAVSEKSADTSMLTTLYGNIGEIFLENQRYDSAFYLLLKSASLANAINDYSTERQALKLLLTIDTLNHDFRKATERYRKILILNDSVYLQRIRNSMEASELRYENQKKSNLIVLQKAELISATRQKQLFLFLFLFFALIVLLLVMLTILLKRSNKRKQELLVEKLKINALELENVKQTEEINKLKLEKTEKEIKIKEKEQVSHALALEQKNELLGLINKKFTEAMKDTGSISITELNGLVSAIKTQVKESSNTDLFNQKFNQLHQTFFHNIQHAHPDLTKTELKFCAYLKLNLTGNQIANIQNVTSEAIRKTRYRIRKKLSLNKEESLENYISTF